MINILIDHQSSNHSILQSIIDMCKKLGMQELAKGVKHESQADLLYTLDCNYIQGFVF